VHLGHIQCLHHPNFGSVPRNSGHFAGNSPNRRRASGIQTPEIRGSGMFGSALLFTWSCNAQPTVARGRQLALEAAEVTPHPARDG